MRGTKMKLSKLITITLCFSAFIPLAVSCQSSKNAVEVDEDYYSETNNQESAVLPEITKTVEEENYLSTEDTIKSAKKQKNAFQEFFTLGNKDDLMVCDETTVFTNGITGKPVQKDAIVVLNTKDGTAGFGTSYLAAYYYVQMNENARHKFAKAVDSYFSDFENKRLNRKNKKSSKIYGSADVKIHWGSLKSSTPNNGSGPMQLGYAFINQSPYFTLTIMPVKNNYYDVVGESTTVESLGLKYYLTKAQAKQLTDMLSEEKISEYLGISKPFIPVENDEY